MFFKNCCPFFFCMDCFTGLDYLSLSMSEETASSLCLQLQSMMLEADGGSLSPGNKPHICEHCAASFRSSYHLRRHVLIHTGKPRVFTQLANKTINEWNVVQRASNSTRRQTALYEPGAVCGFAFVSRRETLPVQSVQHEFHPEVPPPATREDPQR